MANLSQLSGIPWHIEKMTREEGDPRRHRSKCIYYDKSNRGCIYMNGCCIGSAHCTVYSETGYSSFDKNIVKAKAPSNESSTTAGSARPAKNAQKNHTASAGNTRVANAHTSTAAIMHEIEPPQLIFTPEIKMPRRGCIDYIHKETNKRFASSSMKQSGSQYMCIKVGGLGLEKKLALDSIVVKPSKRNVVEDKYRKQMNLYTHKFGKPYRPLIVSYNNGKYYLEDDVSYYYSARDMKLKTVSVRTGSQQFYHMERKLRQSGRTVISAVYGRGTVISTTIADITVKFESGKTQRFQIYDCVINGTFSVQK